MTLEESIEYLTRFGRPSIFQLNDGDWHCKVEMFVTGQGIAFEVKPGRQPTLLEAVAVCRKNMEEAIVQLAERLPRLKG